MSNRLINESSPYLKQHANNPVDWYPYGNEAFEEAARRNCPVIISIGYSACHWCHVMEHESFSNPGIAALMNKNFVCIKVDREERPDVDHIYINAVQLLHGQAGWPLNCFALPDGRPFWGGTYFKPEQWTEVLEHLSELYHNNYDELLLQADRIQQGIRGIGNIEMPVDQKTMTLDLTDEIYNQLSKRFDESNGGMRGAPKFPMPSIWEFVLACYYISKKESALSQYLLTLNKMSMGGIFDQVGGGFARYSTDSEWKVPHFEKMLYDNAQLSILYSDAFRVTGSQYYFHILNKTLEFIKAELTSPEGAFYSALDADSEGVEGKFYTWQKQEILDIFPEYGELLCRYWGVGKQGLWEGDQNILVRPYDDEFFAKHEHLSSEELKQLVNMATRTMLNYRNQRVRPGLDNKIIASWNALMVKAYAVAAAATCSEDWKNTAIKAAGFIDTNFISENGYMTRSYNSGKSSINAFLNDYAFTIDAFIALYQLTFDEKWLLKARDLAEIVLKEFLQEDSPMFWYLPANSEDQQISKIWRIVESSDGVEPSGNAIMAKVLLILGTYFENDGYIKKSEEMCAIMLKSITSYPAAYSQWAFVTTAHAKGLNLIAITGPNALDIAGRMPPLPKIIPHPLPPLPKTIPHPLPPLPKGEGKTPLNSQYNPFTLIAAAISESKIPSLAGKFKENKTLIYSCRNHVCSAPVEEIEDLK